MEKTIQNQQKPTESGKASEFALTIAHYHSPKMNRNATPRTVNAAHLPQQHEPRGTQGLHRGHRARGARRRSWNQATSRPRQQPRRGAARVGRRGRQDHGPSREHALRQDLPTSHPPLQEGQARLFPPLGACGVDRGRTGRNRRRDRGQGGHPRSEQTERPVGRSEGRPWQVAARI